MNIQNLKNKNFRGYITSKKICGNLIPQKLQNLAIREYASKNQIIFKLSGTEWKIPKSFLMINSISSDLKKIDGILFFSFFQIFEDISFFEKTMKKFLKKKKIIIFVLEDIILANLESLNSLIKQIKIYYKISLNNNLIIKKIKKQLI
jgi:sporadic carbohydrate cluster protein (TIGR04323 family)